MVLYHVSNYFLPRFLKHIKNFFLKIYYAMFFHFLIKNMLVLANLNLFKLKIINFIIIFIISNNLPAIIGPKAYLSSTCGEIV